MHKKQLPGAAEVLISGPTPFGIYRTVSASREGSGHRELRCMLVVKYLLSSPLSDAEIAEGLKGVSVPKDTRGFFGLLAGEAAPCPFRGGIDSQKAWLIPLVQPGAPQNDLRIRLTWSEGSLQLTQRSPWSIRAIWMLGVIICLLSVAAELVDGAWDQALFYIAIFSVAFALQHRTFMAASNKNLEILQPILQFSEAEQAASTSR